MYPAFRSLVLALALFAIAAPVLAQQAPPRGGRSATGIAEAAFTSVERSLILDYYARHRVQPERLPPGIAKNLARGKPLPPGIAKRFLPGDLQTSLPPRHTHERIVVGSDVLLVAVATGIVVDIIRNVLR